MHIIIKLIELFEDPAELNNIKLKLIKFDVSLRLYSESYDKDDITGYVCMYSYYNVRIILVHTHTHKHACIRLYRNPIFFNNPQCKHANYYYTTVTVTLTMGKQLLLYISQIVY